MELLPRLITIGDVCEPSGLFRSKIYRLQKKDLFPHSIKLCPRAVRWLLDEVKVAVIVRRAAFGSDEAVCFLVANMQATRSARYSA